MTDYLINKDQLNKLKEIIGRIPTQHGWVAMFIINDLKPVINEVDTKKEGIVKDLGTNKNAT